MELVQFRIESDKNQTLSRVDVVEGRKSIFQFFVLELPWKDNQRNISCIPAGDYWLVKRKANENGSRFNYPHFEVMNVPGRSGIKMHVANYVTQLKGCLAPGEFAKYDLNGDGQVDVSNSTVTLEKLVDLLPGRIKLRIIPHRIFQP